MLVWRLYKRGLSAVQDQPLPVSGLGPPGRELQSDLQLVAACAGLGSIWEKFCWDPTLVAPSARLRAP